MRDTRWRWKPGTRPETVEDWAEVQELERDITLLYHQLSDYRAIMGDLDYGTVYALPYWEYLDPVGLDGQRQRFVQRGCLMMLLAMAWGVIDGSASYLVKHLELCRVAVSRLSTTDATTATLAKTVYRALQAAERGGQSDDLIQESAWAYEAIVRGYFVDRAGEQ